MNIYLVSEGGYSDYRVIAAFSTLQKAEEFKEWTAKAGSPVTIEDPIEIDLWPRNAVHISINMAKNGEVISVSQWAVKHGDYQGGFNYFGTEWIWIDKASGEKAAHQGSHRDNQMVGVLNNILVCGFNTDNKKVAIKAANEVRTHILALGLWGDDGAVRRHGF